MIILGSSSPRRKDILKLCGVSFDIIKPEVDEESIRDKYEIKSEVDKENLVKELSLAKLKSIEKINKDADILCADTLVFLGNDALGKPKDEIDAINMLKRLCGKTHEVLTGVAIKKDGKVSNFCVSTKVLFREELELPAHFIENYVKSGESKGKAGAYGIQDRGAIFVKEIRGDYYNVVGLPIEAVISIYK